MAAQFDTLAAAEAIENAGIDRTAAKVLAAQLRIASDAGDPVTRPELEGALAVLKTDLMERMSSLGWRLVGIVIAANAVLLAAVKLIP